VLGGGHGQTEREELRTKGRRYAVQIGGNKNQITLKYVRVDVTVP